jgi:predicted O-linked N-acetylglucosamine transferase (SPINDLY family)
MKRQHGRQVRAGNRGVVRRAAPVTTTAATTAASSPSHVAHGALAGQAIAEGLQHHQAGRCTQAEACYRQALAADPTRADAHHLLGVLAHQRGQLDRAIRSYRQAIALHPEYPEAFNNLGVALQAQGKIAEAVPCFERAIALAPAYAEAHFNLGAAHQAAGHDDRAVGCYRAALALSPDHLAAHYNLGNAQRALRRLEDAAASYRAAIALDPNHVDANNNLGVVLWELHDEAQATVHFERTLALRPDYRNAHVNLGHSLRQRGLFDEAIESYRRALALDPADDQAHSGVILALDHHPACTPALAYAERRAWNAVHAAALTAAAPPHTNTPDPDRPLRVGYLSTNFVWSSNAFAFGPILAHDPRQVEVACYADISAPDHETERYANGVPLWRNVHGWTHDALAAQIRADRIDILVDLDGHAARTSRLLTFARKPAPIQVTAWGYPTATGLDAMDAIFADAVVIPAAEHRWYAEEVVNLPAVMCVNLPPDLPAVAPAPSAGNGFLTFGAFNQPMKLSAAVLDTWATILAAVPASRMVLKYTGLDAPESLDRIRAAFESRGVGMARVDVLGKTSRYDHLAAYGAIDLALDPFPHGGGVTTFEGLLMGVPCITLLGDRVSGRASASFLTTLGLPDFVSRSREEYVQTAVRVAGDLDRLARERATLRQRLLASPIADHDVYTRAAETAYRALWRRWCAQAAAASSPSV